MNGVECAQVRGAERPPFVTVAVLAVSAFIPRATGPVEYIGYLQDPDNGLNVVAQEQGVNIALQYRPHELVVLQEARPEHVANRAAFVAQLTSLLDKQLAQEQFILLFLDGDRFKSTNDNWGHAAGDEVLRAIDSRLASLAYKQDLVAQLGGDEFVMLITSCATESQLQLLIEEICSAIAQKIMIAEGTPITTSVTIVYARSQHGDTVESILERADMNMYKSKEINEVRI